MLKSTIDRYSNNDSETIAQSTSILDYLNSSTDSVLLTQSNALVCKGVFSRCHQRSDVSNRIPANSSRRLCRC
ncbi:hypothetical protein BJV82DRAFT_612322 [Fennellomyces sp. T-0311]|nr:hypothetical protein BJV82DRAFT_612322 [Fennellomyces sp. T-0311]